MSKIILPKSIVHQLDDISQADPDEWTSEQWAALNKIEIDAAENVQTDVAAYSKMLDNKYRAQTTLFNLARSAFWINGSPYDGDTYKYMRPLLDFSKKYPQGTANLTIVASRQTGKSTTETLRSAGLGMIIPNFQSLYVAPRFAQVRVYSDQRFAPLCEDSPDVAKYWINPNKFNWHITTRQFANRSTFFFRSCYRDADGVRGITARELVLDEIQDLPPDVIKVLEATQMWIKTEDRFRIYTGTHKSTDNGINGRWVNSSQFEWIVPCDRDGVGCKHENMCDESIIQDDKFACAKCGGALNTKKGFWYPMNPSALATNWGFRITQMMMPNKTHADIIAERDDPHTSRKLYLNEILALPYDDGEAGLTRTIMRGACKDYPMLTVDEIRKQYAEPGRPLFAGVDYGSGEGVSPSYTVLTIGTIGPNNVFQVLYMKKFIKDEAELSSQVGIIDFLCGVAGVWWMGADWGFGAHQNARLINEYGWSKDSLFQRKKILLEMMYTSQSRESAVFDPVSARYKLDRNTAISQTIDSIRRHQDPWGITFPRYEDMEPFIDDFTAVKEEYNERSGRYSYVRARADDAFHSTLYAFMAYKQHAGKLIRSIFSSL